MKSGGDASGSGGTLWHGRFASAPSDALMALSRSVHFDARLWEVDIRGSRAHVSMLESVGLLSGTDAQAIQSALDQVSEEFQSGSIVILDSDEDIHSVIERRVTEIAGDAGGRIHTGRSRNDQVATDLRLWCKGAIAELDASIAEMQQVLVARAERDHDLVIPGYTHLQRAQPVMLAHHLLAHFWAFERDRSRLHDLLRRVDICPLGAGALAGSSLPLDPAQTAKQLGFSAHFENSLDAVSDRDFVVELLSALALMQVHCSRIGEEVVLWTTEEFGFATLDDAYATGSSMLPQKKNPDIAELARGKAGRVIGNLTGTLAMLKGLPLSYNRDLQEDKEALFDSTDTVLATVRALTGMLQTISFRKEALDLAAAAPVAVATDLAEALVREGTPFRAAHAIVGALVRESLETQTPLVELAVRHESFGERIRSLFDAGAVVRARTTPGSGGPDAVAIQLRNARACLDER